MELPTLLNKLDKVTKSGDGKFLALCPAHQDKEASLSVTSDHKKLLVHCFAGCTTESIVKSLGLSVSDLFLDKKPQSQQKKVVKTYDYTDEAGELLFQVCRLEPKSFMQRHKNGRGDWIWSMAGVQRVLYHLPDIIKASEVYFVEGEKDADNLHAHGLVTTTSPGGANAWKNEYARCLIAKKVILVPDSDPTGHAYVSSVACSLMGKAQLSCILLPSKDISDWLSEGHDIKELAPMEQDISVLLWGFMAQVRRETGEIARRLRHLEQVFQKPQDTQQQRPPARRKAGVSID